MKNALSLTAAADRGLIDASVPSQRYVEWEITAASAAPSADRPPLNLAIVLDRSGSMSDANKLEFARQAARHVVKALTERDRLALISFDTRIETHLVSSAVTPQVRNRALMALNGLRPGSSTDLHGGWLAGAEQAASNVTGDSVNRVLLLTDGLANHGETRQDVILGHVAGLNARGVSTSTFGVGYEYNEQLLRPMAECGGGQYYFIESPGQITAMFAEELGELCTVVARDAVLEILPPAGVAVNILGGLPHDSADGRMRVPLGAVSGGKVRSVYATVLTPPGVEGAPVTLEARLTWIGDDGAERVSAAVRFQYGAAAAVESAPRDMALAGRAGEVDMAEAVTRAIALEKSGDRAGAQRAVRYSMAVNAPVLAEDTMDYLSAVAEELEEGMEEPRRKELDQAAFVQRRGRK